MTGAEESPKPAPAEAPETRSPWLTPMEAAQANLDVALTQLPIYIVDVVTGLNRSIAAARSGSPGDSVILEGLSRIFHVDAGDVPNMTILCGLYGRYLSKLPGLKDVIFLDSFEREQEIQADPAREGQAAFCVIEEGGEDPRGIHVMPSAFSRLDSRRRPSALFHEMGRFFFDLEDFDPRPTDLPAWRAMRSNAAFNWLALQIWLRRTVP